MIDIKNQKKYYPMIVQKITETDDIFFARWDRFNSLPQNIQDILSSEEIARFIYGVEQRYRLKDEQTEEFSRTVRGYFFREITERGFVNAVTEMCRISPDEALKLLRSINAIIPKNDLQLTQEEKPVKISLEKAYTQYPQIKEQIITSQAIASKPFLNPLKPTVNNWIIVYEKVLGVANYNTLARGEFVYSAQATQGLSEDERKKLLILFKSHDEGSDLLIDPIKKMIVFEEDNSFDDDTSLQTNTRVQGPDSIQHGKSQQGSDIKKRGFDMRQRSQTYGQQTNRKQENTVVRENFSQENNNISAPTIAQEEKLLKKTTQKLENFMGTMQRPTLTQVSRAQVAPLVSNAVLDTALKAEITKNRQEMHGVSSEVNVAKHEKDENENNILDNDISDTNDQSQHSASYNTVRFSSNHIFPAEKDKQKTLQTSKNLYSMRPIGEGHYIKQQKKNN